MHLIKTQEELVAQARKMAEDFAKVKAKEYTKVFLKDSNLAEELFALYEKEQFKNGRSVMPREEYFDHLVEDYHMATGKFLSIAYAIGFIDSAERVDKKVYAKAKKIEENSKPSLEKPVNLIRPQGD